MWLRIESFQNPRVKAAAALRKSEERRRTGRVIIDGLREIRRAYEGGVILEQVFFCPSVAPPEARSFVEILASRGITVLELPARVYERVAFGEREEGLVAVGQAPNRSLQDLVLSSDLEPPLVLVAEGIEKPGNLGAMIRTADGAGASAVIAADLRTDLYNPAAIRASLGTIFGLPVVSADAPSTLQFLRQQGLHILAARVNGAVPYYEADMTGPVAIILGSEAEGLSELWQGGDIESVSIPMRGRADSLNVSVAAAVLLYEARRQRLVGCQGRSQPSR